MPRIWNRKHDRDIPADAVYVGRPSKWGNPFSSLGEQNVHPNVRWHTRTRDEAVDGYAKWLRQPAQDQLRDDMRQELRGRDLVCWCAPARCHAEIIREVANPPAIVRRRQRK